MHGLGAKNCPNESLAGQKQDLLSELSIVVQKNSLRKLSPIKDRVETDQRERGRKIKKPKMNKRHKRHKIDKTPTRPK